MNVYRVIGLLLILLLAVPFVSAQDEKGSDTAGDVVGITAPIPPDCVLELPGSSAAQPGLVVIFRNLNERLVVPRVDGSNFVLTCASPDEDAQIVQRSPSVPFGAIPPRPNNPDTVIDDLEGYAIVNAYSANIRSCDDVSCTQVALADGGDRLVVLGHNQDFSWWYVQAGDTRGWISNEIVFLRGDLTDLPFVATEGERTPPSVYVGYPGNPIFERLVAGSPLVCRIQGDNSYRLLGQSFNEEWLKIEATCLDGTPATGWMEAEFAIIRNPGNVPIPTLRN